VPAAAGPARFDAAALVAELARRTGVRARRDEPLARYSTMRVGGPAAVFATAHNAFELRALVRFARSRGLPHLVLGRGSDLVISDRGFPGLVIQVRAEGSRFEGERYVAEAGVPMARAATETGRAGLTGLEFGLAIPGTVGGAVWANAGAHGSDVAAVLESADVLLADGREERLGGADLRFGYRDSRFKHADGPAEVVLSATFRLTPASATEVRDRLDEIRHWRQAHQPLGLASAGSVFRNPADGPAAGLLIDRAGLKGRRIGGASVSEKHANFIVNDRRGSAADVRRLAESIRDEIRARDGLELELEIEFVGDWAGWPWPPPEPAAGAPTDAGAAR
jgi:UDP-N-acetylmuramate dehydrogenase